MALDDALHLLGVDLLTARVDAGRVAPEEEEPAVLGPPRAVAADAVAYPVDHGERLAGALGVAEVAEGQVAPGGEPTHLIGAGFQRTAPVVREKNRVVAQLVGRVAAGPGRRVPAHGLQPGLGRADALDEHRAVGEERRKLALDAR